MFNEVPESPTSPGTSGQIVCDDEYLYVCVAPGQWKRIKLETW